MLWLINFESSQWVSGWESKVVVEAESAEEAEIKASDFMEEVIEEEMRGLFQDEYEDEEDTDVKEECAYRVISVEPFDEAHEEWQYLKDESQKIFYPVII